MLSIKTALTSSIFLVLSFTVSVQAQTPTPTPTPEEPVVDTTTEIEDFAEPVRSESQDDNLQAAVQDVQLRFTILCRTEEGRRLILNNEDSINVRDQEFQWQGLRANNQTSEPTFDDYRLAALKRRCNEPPDYVFVIGPVQPLGTCQDVKFGPPLYDVEATVQKICDLESYYRTSTDPWVGTNEGERKANLNRVISSMLNGLEVNLRLHYTQTRCKVGNTGNCVSGTGVKKVCEKKYIYAPPYQILIPSSLKGGDHVKVGPVLESPTVAWFRVGKTGHGENFGTATAESTFDEKGATQKARMDVDAIRRILIERGLPTDKIPPILEKPQPNVSQSPTTPITPKPKPARLEKTYGRRGNTNYYDVVITNTGGSPATVGYRIFYLDGFYQSRPPVWKEKATLVNIIIPAGQTHRNEFHDWHALNWRIEFAK